MQTRPVPLWKLKDIRCWMAPRDIAPGADWAGSIVEAIDNCRAMVLIFSAHSNGSKQVYREVQQAFDGDKPVVPFRIENVTPAPTLRYYMNSVHWLDALTPPIEQHLKVLTASVRYAKFDTARVSLSVKSVIASRTLAMEYGTPGSSACPRSAMR